MIVFILNSLFLKTEGSFPQTLTTFYTQNQKFFPTAVQAATVTIDSQTY